MNEKQDYVYKERDSGGKELLSMLIYRPIARFLLEKIFKHANVTPNQISCMSLGLVAAGCLFFAFTAYPYFLIGFLFLHAGYAFDMLDGMYARYKGLSSKYGKWFDPFVDVIKVVLLFSALSYGSFTATNRPLAFFWGMLGMANAIMVFYIMNTREHVIKRPPFELKLQKNIYLGYEINFYWVLSLIGLFNLVYQGLVFLATFGALAWIKLYLSFRQYYYKHKEEIESEQ